MRLIALELKLLLRGMAVPLGVGMLFVAGVCALAYGRTVIERQRAATAESPARQAEEHRRVLSPLPATAMAGDQLYYLFFHTVREPSDWAPVAIGGRDVQSFNLKVRMHALQGQLYDTDLGNPLLASFGHFDLAFVIVVLAPLVAIAVSHNVRSAEVESGTWDLLRSQPIQVGWLLVLKYALRALVVWIPLLVLQVVATMWLRLPLDGLWGLVALSTLAYVAVWVAVAVAIDQGRRSSDFNVLALLGVWVIWTALGPALVNVMASARFPMPEALESTVLQRQGFHGAWDEPLPEVMEAFYRRYPEWRSVPIPRDRYSNGWYYAMHQRGDDMARAAATQYRARLEERDRWVGRASWLIPPAAFQRLLSRVARTDVRSYLAYLDSVAVYHEQLKRHFFPVVFGEKTVGDVDWTTAPRHRHRD